MLKEHYIDFTKLKSNTINESFVAQWAADVKYILSHILSQGAIAKLEEEEKDKKKILVKGTKEDLAAFSDALKKEKEYALEYIDSGIGSSTLTDRKLELEKSIHNFEKTTGLIWPIR